MRFGKCIKLYVNIELLVANLHIHAYTYDLSHNLNSYAGVEVDNDPLARAPIKNIYFLNPSIMLIKTSNASHVRTYPLGRMSTEVRTF